MELKEVLNKLQELGDERARKIWARTGLDVSNYYGVNLTKLKKLAKDIKKDHGLALELWETGIHDAKLLATMVEDPKQATEDQIDKWISEAQHWDLSDKLASNVVVKTPFAEKKIEEWLIVDKEFYRRSAFALIGGLAKNKKSQLDFDSYLDLISDALDDKYNFVRDGANMALISVGARSKELHQKALKIAKDHGKVEVDYGDNSCEALDAVKHLTSERILKKIK